MDDRTKELYEVIGKQTVEIERLTQALKSQEEEAAYYLHLYIQERSKNEKLETANEAKKSKTVTSPQKKTWEEVNE